MKIVETVQIMILEHETILLYIRPCQLFDRAFAFGNSCGQVAFYFIFHLMLHASWYSFHISTPSRATSERKKNVCKQEISAGRKIGGKQHILLAWPKCVSVCGSIN